MQQLLFCCWIYSGYVIFYEIFIVIERDLSESVSMHVYVTLKLPLINQLCSFYITHEGRQRRMSKASFKKVQKAQSFQCEL